MFFFTFLFIIIFPFKYFNISDFNFNSCLLQICIIDINIILNEIFMKLYEKGAEKIEPDGRYHSLLTLRAECLYIFGGICKNSRGREQRIDANHAWRFDLLSKKWQMLPVHFCYNFFGQAAEELMEQKVIWENWWQQKGKHLAPTIISGCAVQQTDNFNSPMFIYPVRRRAREILDFLIIEPKAINGRQIERLCVQPIELCALDNSLANDRPTINDEPLLGDYQCMQIMCASPTRFFCVWNTFKAMELIDGAIQRLNPAHENWSILLIYKIEKMKNANKWTWQCLSRHNYSMPNVELQSALNVVVMNNGKGLFLEKQNRIFFLPSQFQQRSDGAGDRHRLSFLVTFSPTTCDFASFFINPDTDNDDFCYPHSINYKNCIAIDDFFLFIGDISENVWQLDLCNEYKWKRSQKFANFEPNNKSTIIYSDGTIYQFGGWAKANGFNTQLSNSITAIRLRPLALAKIALMKMKMHEK